MYFGSVNIKTVLLIAVWLLIGTVVSAQKKSVIYLQRAEKMYSLIWKNYRVPAYSCLFAENYPTDKKDSLDYFQGAKVKPKAISFLWPFSGVFSATNVLLQLPATRKKYLPYLDSMVTGIEKYRDTIRKPTGYQAYPSMFEKDDRYYDDNGLVGIEYMEAYFNTKNPVYLTRAKTVFKFIISGWDEQLGGGIFWLEGHKDQKPACSNGMALLVALKLYKATKDPYYLKWGTRFYNWMQANLSNPDGVFYNDKKTADGSVNKTYWTYNSGSILEASVLLYQFTKDVKYLAEAKHIANGTYQHFKNEKHDAHLNMRIDEPWFVAVLVRGYAALYAVDGNYNYIEAISKDLDYAWDNTRDQYGFVTKSFTPNPAEMQKPKWLLVEASIAEMYARLSQLERSRNN
ncbi:glycoside hydrolase family 76 protein [Mucilaginibacter sp.]|uniref:glycoside hydrolase family 76 protein n=1 Tax=Mucilaginibacter sp. TaxID=1882438 RepID=UPI003D141967